MRTFSSFRTLVWGLLSVAAACRPATHAQRQASDPPADSTQGALDHPLTRPPVITEATVVAFWLKASDTLKGGEAADLLDDFRNYTALVAPMLKEQDIALVATTAESVIVKADSGPRRVIMLAGLDYPFGYVLVEPGYAETILTGVSTDDELLEQVDWYFGTDEGEDDNSDGARIVRASGVTLPAEWAPRRRAWQGKTMAAAALASDNPAPARGLRPPPPGGGRLAGTHGGD